MWIRAFVLQTFASGHSWKSETERVVSKSLRSFRRIIGYIFIGPWYPVTVSVWNNMKTLRKFNSRDKLWQLLPDAGTTFLPSAWTLCVQVCWETLEKGGHGNYGFSWALSLFTQLCMTFVWSMGEKAIKGYTLLLCIYIIQGYLLLCVCYLYLHAAGRLIDTSWKYTNLQTTRGNMNFDSWSSEEMLQKCICMHEAGLQFIWQRNTLQSWEYFLTFKRWRLLGILNMKQKTQRR